MRRKNQKSLLALLLIMIVSLFAVISGCSGEEKNVKSAGESQETKDKEEKVVRIGYQKYGTLNILKKQGTLDKALKSHGYSVEWIQFPAGPQLLEGLNVGSIDIGHTGEAPPIFAQAAGTDLVYIGHEPESPLSEAILVPKDSPIRTVQDLKGKKVALNKGSNVHYLLVKALEKAGLTINDIEPKYLVPGDARAAFEQGSVDAWVIWDPFFAVAETETGARVLADGKDLVKNREFYLASRKFAENHKEVIDLLLEEINKTDQWAKSAPKEVAELLSPELGIDVASLEKAAKRRTYGVQKISEQVLNDQQVIADTFHQLKLISEKINVKEAALEETNN
ncbi:sulfonate ABC transporter substrate-binding protein [Aeribacillus composti]|uniref:sulfonate ABC transporter substrate-binding protein n=1 Tax=Aeribacillus composti TaxID=1868734 RepID=UPI003D1CE44B